MIIQTNAKTVSELDLAMYEAEQLTHQHVEYHGSGRINASGGPEYMNNTAYGHHIVNMDGSPDVATEWTKLQELKPDLLPDHGTHNLYAYEGKMHPQLARALINLCGVYKNSKVLDPFCGSGTVLVEAAIRGADCYGVDSSPFACWLTETKLFKTTRGFKARVERLRHCGGVTPCSDAWRDAIVEAHCKCRPKGRSFITLADAVDFLEGAPTFDGGIMDAVVTSPPYFNAIDYQTRHAALAKELGAGEPLKQMGTGQQVSEYQVYIQRIADGMARALRTGGGLAIVVGDYQNIDSVNLWELYLKAAGLTKELRFERPYREVKHGIGSDTILVFKK